MVGGKPAFFSGKPGRVLKELSQQLNLLRKDADIIGLRARLKRPRRPQVSAGRPAQPEIDASGMQRLEHAETFGHLERARSAACASPIVFAIASAAVPPLRIGDWSRTLRVTMENRSVLGDGVTACDRVIGGFLPISVKRLFPNRRL
jgi:hypothetical protein